MRQKMINLCPTTFEQASKMNNFSEWVRLKLKEINDADPIDDFEYLFVCMLGCQRVKEGQHPPKCQQHHLRMKIVPSKPL